MGLTLLEKLATAHAVGLAPGDAARSGDFVTIRPRHIMTHDNTGAVIPKFKEIFKAAGLPPKIHDSRQPVFAIDHDIQNHSPENLGKYAKIEAFANEHAIDFYPAGTGISHQVMVEQGYVRPGTMVVGSDSHSNLYGALCCLGTPVVRTDAASLWATGQTWWQVPPVARVTLTGKLRSGVVGKDVIVALCGVFNEDQVLNHAVEFTGDGIASLSIDQRMSIANMSTEWGALAGLFPFDLALRDYLHARAAYFGAGKRPGTRRAGSLGGYDRAAIDSWWEEREHLRPDPDAGYAVGLEIDLGSIVPHVSGPNNVKTIVPVPSLEPGSIRINKAWLMSCVNGRLEDLAAAADIVRGKHVPFGVEFFVAAASADVQTEAMRLGHWQSLLEAGAIALPPGCGTCIGLGAGTIKAGEVGISATNRNFEGRMGHPDGQVYLGSPAVVAASAIAGYICAPERYPTVKLMSTIRWPLPPEAKLRAREIIPGFPEQIVGNSCVLREDNINTDAIYAGKHTYNDALKPREMALLAFENYDRDIRNHLGSQTILVAGKNFGCGSSREQAATAIKYAGVPCIIAASFSETYKRNAFNNGLIVIECPELARKMSDAMFEAPEPRPGYEDDYAPERFYIGTELRIDFKSGLITCGDGSHTQAFPFVPPSRVAQELIVAGGAEAVVAARLRQSQTPQPPH